MPPLWADCTPRRCISQRWESEKARKRKSKKPEGRSALRPALPCFPGLAAGRHDRPAVHELVQLKSRDVQVSPIWKGEAMLNVLDHPHTELAALRPQETLAGYRFSCALTVDDLVLLRDLRAAGVERTD